MFVNKTFNDKNKCAFPISSYRKETMHECLKHILPYQEMVARHESIHVIYKKGNHQGNKIVIYLHQSSSSSQLNHVKRLRFFFAFFSTCHHIIHLHENPIVLVQRIYFLLWVQFENIHTNYNLSSYSNMCSTIL